VLAHEHSLPGLKLEADVLDTDPDEARSRRDGADLGEWDRHERHDEVYFSGSVNRADRWDRSV
jgi:hypothetical protein